MKGQWIGQYTGSNTGTIIVNVDEVRTHFQGSAFFKDNNAGLPGSVAFFKTPDKSKSFQFRVQPILPIDPQTGVFSSWEQVKPHYATNLIVPQWADVSGSWDAGCLKLAFKTDIGTGGSCVLPSSNADKVSEITPLKKDWRTYKEYVAGLEGSRYLFRGQNKPWRLRTSFHRSGRADLHRFVMEDMQVLHKHLSARTKHVFDLNTPNENGAFLNLIQHHGYPTPLLDWSYSPYVAAFFAFRGISGKAAGEVASEESVRIHVFDQAKWKSDWNQLSALLTTAPHLSIGEFMAIENERLIPQQGASTITNLDDIETYVRSKETKDRQYLWAIDLPVNERNRVVQELSYMGITPGSLFPGLDGACEELKERNFGA